jgi:hypothetical protein
MIRRQRSGKSKAHDEKVARRGYLMQHGAVLPSRKAIEERPRIHCHFEQRPSTQTLKPVRSGTYFQAKRAFCANHSNATTCAKRPDAKKWSVQHHDYEGENPAISYAGSYRGIARQLLAGGPL